MAVCSDLGLRALQVAAAPVSDKRLLVLHPHTLKVHLTRVRLSRLNQILGQSLKASVLIEKFIIDMTALPGIPDPAGNIHTFDAVDDKMEVDPSELPDLQPVHEL